jgi:predicted ATPase
MSDTNLSLQLTNFIGHEVELAGVRQLLSSGATRLVTLTGAGGIGKPRFALEVASDLLEAIPNGVWLIDLAGLSEPARVTQAVAEAFDLRETPHRPVITTATTFVGA